MLHYNFENFDDYACIVYLCANNNAKPQTISKIGYIKKANISLILGPIKNEAYKLEVNVYDDTKGIFKFVFNDEKVAKEEFIKMIQHWNL